MPLKHFPEDHRTGEDINFVVVLRMWVPELRGLPVNRPDQTADHRPSRLLDLSQPKVCDLGNPLRCDENVRRLAISMNDRGFSSVQIL